MFRIYIHHVAPSRSPVTPHFQPGRETVAMIEAAGGEATFVRADISKAAEVEALVAEAVARHGRLDVAFNNAGIGEVSPRLADLEESDFDRNFNINVRGTFLCMKYEIKHMLKQGGGAIINNASIQSHIAIGHSAHYTACKHAILGYTRAGAVDYAKDNIRINAISPGPVLTAMTSVDPNAPEAAPLLMRIPAGRVGAAEEIVGAVVFLASDMASYVHGASLAIDGGWLAH